MISCLYYTGREPQCPVIVYYRNSVLYRLGLSCSNMSGHGELHSGLYVLLTFHIQLLHGYPCAWSFDTQLCVTNITIHALDHNLWVWEVNNLLLSAGELIE